MDEGFEVVIVIFLVTVGIAITRSCHHLGEINEKMSAKQVRQVESGK